MRLTGVVLRHKRVVVLAWLVIAVAGFATIGKATGALSASFSIPGRAFTTDSTIQRLYHNGGFQNPPLVLTATLPSGAAAGPATVAEAGRLFAAAARAVPGRWAGSWPRRRRRAGRPVSPAWPSSRPAPAAARAPAP